MHFYGLLLGLLITVTTPALAASDTETLSTRDMSLLAGALVALLTWIGGQVLIPLYKHRWEQQRGKALTITIMKVMADKTLDFFGDNLATSAFDKVLYRIDEQIETARANPQFVAHISVSEDDLFNTRVLDMEHFWLVDEPLMNAFIKFEENASRARFMCRSVMDKDYLKLVEQDRRRYVSALEQIKQQFEIWLTSTRELAGMLKQY